MGEDVEDELADVVVDATTARDGGDDGREVIVGEHHRRRLARDIGAGRPMATPMSARLRAGASLTPSPVIATTSPSARNDSAIRSFASGELREDQLTAGPQDRVELCVADAIQLPAGDTVGLSPTIPTSLAIAAAVSP